MAATLAKEDLVKQKLEAFERMQPEFEANFGFIQNVHGQLHLTIFPVSEIVHYLHALWICTCKDRLLSVSENGGRYEGFTCLNLLRSWQEGDSASVIAFLQHKLDGLLFADLTRQLQEAVALRSAANEGLIHYLMHGRLTLLNRGMHLMQALDAIFSLSEADLMREVRAACVHYGHLPSQIEQQLAQRESPLFSYTPHQLLAQQNMLIMNKVGIHTMTLPKAPGKHLWHIVIPEDSLRPFAEHIIQGYQELTSQV